MQLENHLIGLLLGDGCLEMGNRSKNACLRITRTLSDKEYLHFSSNVFKKYSSKKAVLESSYFDRRTNKTYYRITYRSRSLPFLTKFYHDWYKDKRKIIPKNFELNPEIIATWFADDGSIRIDKRIYDVKLSTNSFKEREVLFLIKELKKIKINANMYCYSGQPIIRITKKSEVKKFVDLIKDPFKQLKMNRKEIWNDKYHMLVSRNIIPCKYCNSNNTYKNGHNNCGKQKYLCNDCRKQFIL